MVASRGWLWSGQDYALQLWTPWICFVTCGGICSFLYHRRNLASVDLYSPVHWARAMDAHDFSRTIEDDLSRACFPSGYRWCDPQPPVPSDRRFGCWEEHFYSRPSRNATIDRAKMFGAERQIRLRPSYFLFTEPSVEVDVSCFKCGGAGCNVCKKLVGLKSWEPVWFTHASLRWVVLTQQFIQDLPLDLVKSVWLCFVAESMISVASIKGISVFQNNLNYHVSKS